MLEFAVKLGFQFLELRNGELCYVDCDLLEDHYINDVLDSLWPEPGCPCFEAILCRAELLLLSIDRGVW